MKSLFFAMFTDNSFVKENSLSKDKMNYYINYGIVPVFRGKMLLIRVNWLLHSVLFDSSFCHIFRDNQLDVDIRIWDCVKCQANKMPVILHQIS